jgi:hypothetical protein
VARCPASGPRARPRTRACCPQGRSRQSRHSCERQQQQQQGTATLYARLSLPHRTGPIIGTGRVA